MIQPPLLPDEPERLKALMSLGILHTPAEERFDRITRMATKVLNAPIALVSLVADDHQWFKSAHGIEATETPRDISFCGHTIATDGPMIVENALDDERFRGNPLVVDGPQIRAYAGQPIRVGEGGHRVGTLCVIDLEPRAFTPDDVSNLRDLAALVEAEIQHGVLTAIQTELLEQRDELQRKATIDPLTRLWNRGAIMELLERELSRARRGTPISVAMIDADHFKRINDTYGHPVGDEVLAEIAKRIRSGIRDCDDAGRYGGEEFLVLLNNCDAAHAHIAGERIRVAVAKTPIASSAGPLEMTVSVGITTYGPQPTAGNELVAACDRALYAAKGKGRNRVETAEDVVVE
jgi:diguanylate cyclase (GGDEF)-like protein